MKPEQDMAALGRKGGAAVKLKHGKEHFKRVGRAGGEATRDKLGSEHYQQIGRKGGAAAAAIEGHSSAAGRKGGQTTRDRFSGEHYQQIGRKGASVAKAQRQRGAHLLAALAPFRSWLETMRDDMRRLQKDMPEAAELACLFPPSPLLANTYGDCARLLAVMDGLTPTIVDPRLSLAEAQKLATMVAKDLGQRVIVVGQPSPSDRDDGLLAHNANAAEGKR